MSDVKKCPFCQKEIVCDANRCKYCGQFMIENTNKRYSSKILAVKVDGIAKFYSDEEFVKKIAALEGESMEKVRDFIKNNNHAIFSNLPNEKASELYEYFSSKKGLKVLKEEELKGVNGWLLFFLIMITCLNPANFLSALRQMSPATYLTNGLSLTLLIVQFALTVAGVFAGYQMWKRNPPRNAVKFARWVVFLFFLYDLVNLSLFIVLHIVSPEIVRYVGFTLSALLWLCYLHKSKRVANTYGSQ